jgi:hypothetical protein
MLHPCPLRSHAITELAGKLVEIFGSKAVTDKISRIKWLSEKQKAQLWAAPLLKLLLSKIAFLRG